MNTVKPLSRMTKKQLIQLASERLQHVIILKQDIEQAENEALSKLNELRSEVHSMRLKIDTSEKDVSIMQSALNDVEEKNRFLNNQVLNLKHSLKVMSQFL